MNPMDMTLRILGNMGANIDRDNVMFDLGMILQTIVIKAYSTLFDSVISSGRGKTVDESRAQKTELLCRPSLTRILEQHKKNKINAAYSAQFHEVRHHIGSHTAPTGGRAVDEIFGSFEPPQRPLQCSLLNQLLHHASGGRTHTAQHQRAGGATHRVHGTAEQRIGGTIHTNRARTTDCLRFTGTHFARGIVHALVIIWFTRNAYYRAPDQIQIAFLPRTTQLLASNHTHHTGESA